MGDRSLQYNFHTIVCLPETLRNFTKMRFTKFCVIWKFGMTDVSTELYIKTNIRYKDR